MAGRQLFFHIHIWKTAGTTFFSICRRNFDKGFRRDSMLIQDWSLTRQQLEWIVEYHGWLRCYSCHMLSADLPFDLPGVDIRGLTFVRDPIDRYVSCYHYQASIEKIGTGSRVDSFEQFCRETLGEYGTGLYSEGQTFLLGGRRDRQGVDNAIRLAREDKLVLLVAERFDESCLLLEAMFPAFSDCSYIPLNVSPKREEVGPRGKELIRELNPVDIQLHEQANAFLDEALKKHVGGPEVVGPKLAEFRERCAARLRKARRRERLMKPAAILPARVKGLLKAIGGN